VRKITFSRLRKKYYITPSRLKINDEIISFATVYGLRNKIILTDAQF